MMIKCTNCDGAGVVVVTTFRGHTRLEDCEPCEGIGRRHVCEYAWCRTNKFDSSLPTKVEQDLEASLRLGKQEGATRDSQPFFD